MRVVSGKARGRKLQAVPGTTTRPILDRVKTALFDILRPRIEGIELLDLFAGSGSVGIEALSQGAKQCVFLDLEKKAVETIRANLEHCQLKDQGEVRQTDAFTYLKNTSRVFDLIYVAPPQYKSLWVEALQAIAERPSLVKPGGMVIAQIDPKEDQILEFTDFKRTGERKYGSTLLVFFERN